MKLKFFSFIIRNQTRNVYQLNYNKPINNSLLIINNYIKPNYRVQQPDTVGTKLVKISELLIKRLSVIEEKNTILLKKLKSLSRM